MENALELQVIADSLHNRLQNNAVHVPLLPELTLDALRISRTPGSQPEQLAALLSKDRSMSAKLLQLGQSGLFGQPGEPHLESLILHLGQQAVADMALALCLNTGLFHAPGYAQSITEQLRQAVLCGLWSREVAMLRRRYIEAAFICGLCKSIGRPVVIEAALECAVRHRMHLSYDDLMVLADQFEYGATQRVLGAWQMPEVVHAVAAHWLDYHSAGEAQGQTMTTAAGARLTALFGKQGKHIAGKEQLLKERIVAELGLSDQQIDHLCRAAARITATADGFI
ncbi:MAG: HDOD domain-containing protein [Cellvibrionaceae bacterium]|nr:HDOD domain-containing protein [Cellvibrionaceae bacterium]